MPSGCPAFASSISLSRNSIAFLPRWLLCFVATLALGYAGGDGKPTTPRFKWAQTRDQVFITVMVRDLDRSSVSMAVSPDMEFNFAARSTKGEEFALSFPFREDVEVETAKSEASTRPEKWGDGVVLSVNKVHTHRWDVLTPEAKKFKALMDKDWVREDPKLEPEEEVPYFDDNKKYLQKLTVGSFNKTMDRYSTVIANLRFPWCTQCKNQDDIFAKVAKSANKKAKEDDRWKGIAFAVIDAREERSLARDFGAQCHFNCEYLVFSGPDKGQAEQTLRLKAKWTESELLADVTAFLRPAVTIAESKDIIPPLSAQNTTCVGSFRSNTSEEFHLFSRIANIIRLQGGGVIFVAHFDGSLSSAEVTLSHPRPSFSLTYEDGFADNGTAFLTWLRPRAVPLLQVYSWELKETYERLHLPFAKLWLDDKAENQSLNELARDTLHRVAQKYLGRLALVEVKRSTHSFELGEYGLKHPEVYPAFGVAANVSYSSIKYAFEAMSTADFWQDADRAFDQIAAFCEKVLAGDWPLAHESGPVHHDWTAGELKRLVWKSWDELRSPQVPILLAVTSKYRSDYPRKDKEIENLARAFADFSDRLLVAAYDASENFIDREFFKRDKYSPDVEWYWVPLREDGQDYPKIKKLGKPKKDASAEAVFEFVRKQSGMDVSVEDLVKKFQEAMEKDPPQSEEEERDERLQNAEAAKARAYEEDGEEL